MTAWQTNSAICADMPASSSRTTSAPGGRRSFMSASTPAPMLKMPLSPGCSSRNCCGGAQTTAWSACGAPGRHSATSAPGSAARRPSSQGGILVSVQQTVRRIVLIVEES